LPRPVLLSVAGGDLGISEVRAPLPLDELVGGGGPWEVEIGFGKGRYLLRRCQAEPERRFLGIEVAGLYQRTFVDRARRRGTSNWLALRGEALYLLSAVLPAGFAAAVHVYFPDPWPKTRHQRRRLFDAESVDLVIGLLQAGGRLSFATDFLEYGEKVADLLAGVPGLEIRRREEIWDEGPRTNYEAKYELEGRPILRLEGIWQPRLGDSRLHPDGERGVVV
jgi:tRNA (guanine-N7-)-methyltransferase